MGADCGECNTNVDARHRFLVSHPNETDQTDVYDVTHVRGFVIPRRLRISTTSRVAPPGLEPGCPFWGQKILSLPRLPISPRGRVTEGTTGVVEQSWQRARGAAP